MEKMTGEDVKNIKTNDITETAGATSFKKKEERKDDDDDDEKDERNKKRKLLSLLERRMMGGGQKDGNESEAAKAIARATEISTKAAQAGAAVPGGIGTNDEGATKTDEKDVRLRGERLRALSPVRRRRRFRGGKNV